MKSDIFGISSVLNINGFLATVEKSFDSVNHSFLLLVFSSIAKDRQQVKLHLLLYFDICIAVFFTKFCGKKSQDSVFHHQNN